MSSFKDFLIESDVLSSVLKVPKSKLDVNGRLITPYPEKMSKCFDCSEIPLTSLVGSPKEVDGYFNCSKTKIKTFEGGPTRVNEGFYCQTLKLTSIEGAPSFIGANMYISGSRVPSLSGIHKIIKHINGNLYCYETVIGGAVLGVLLIDGLRSIVGLEQHAWFKILDRHMSGQRDVLDCQEELIKAGFKEYAKL